MERCWKVKQENCWRKGRCLKTVRSCLDRELETNIWETFERKAHCVKRHCTTCNYFSAETTSSRSLSSSLPVLRSFVALNFKSKVPHSFDRFRGLNPRSELNRSLGMNDLDFPGNSIGRCAKSLLRLRYLWLPKLFVNYILRLSRVVRPCRKQELRLTIQLWERLTWSSIYKPIVRQTPLTFMILW